MKNIIESKTNSLITFRTLSKKEVKFYQSLPCGVQQTPDMIRTVTIDNEKKEKHILEQTVSGVNRITVKMRKKKKEKIK